MHFKKVLCILLSVFILVPSLVTLAAEDQHGLKADYYLVSSSYNFSELKATGVDSTLDFSDLTSILKSKTGSDTFAGIRWTGQIQADVTGAYTFYAIGDNGFKLWVNDQLIIDFWQNQWDKEQTSTSINLTAGQKYKFRLEYFQATGGANLHVSWSAPGLTKEIIPASNFFLDSTYTGPTVSSVDSSKANLVSNNPLGTITFNGKGLQNATVEAFDVNGDSYSPKVNCDVVTSTDTALTFNVPQNLPVGKVSFGVTNQGITYKTSPILVTYDYGTGVPRPEYPRPDWQRDKWMNLNGQWSFNFDSSKTGDASSWFAKDHTFTQNITVPYPWESPLSGINNPTYVGVAWYQRDLNLDNSWNGKKIMLNFGAVDWKCSLWINGTKVGDHVGGYSQFGFDITSFVTIGSTNKITLKVEDDKYTNHDQLVGKQGKDAPVGYTASSGIWQTVYLEGIDSTSYFQIVHATPDIDKSQVTFDITAINDDTANKTVSISYDFKGTKYDQATKKDKDNGYTFNGSQTNLTLKQGTNNFKITVTIPNQQLWNTENPNLYKGTFTLTDTANSKELDKVGTYFGQRKISVNKLDSRDYQYINLNNKPVFLSGLLDQGFWPDGLYTAPTDGAIQSDLQNMKDDGFNLIRNHIKIEDPRELYWADQIGFCTWEDMPEGNYTDTTAGRQAYEFALSKMIERDYNHPGVLAIILFNETWGYTHNDSFHTWTKDLYNKVKSLNSQLLVEDMSACAMDHIQPTDLFTYHMYPGSFTDANNFVNEVDTKSTVGSTYMFRTDKPEYKNEGEPWLNSEYGGVASNGGDIDVSWCFKYQTTLLRLHERLNGYVYTETNDVEYEKNGILNYNRTKKVFGYEDAAYGGDMSFKYLNQPDFIGFYNEPVTKLAPGSVFNGKIGAMNWSGNNYSNLTLEYRLDGTDSYGNSISTGIEGSMPITFAPYTEDNKDFSFTIPNTSKYSKFVGTVTAWIEDASGNTIAKNFTNLNVTDGSAFKPVTKLQDNSYVLRQPSAGAVTNQAEYSYTVPDDMNISSLSQLKIIAEMSSDKPGITQTSAGEEVPSDVTVSINGHEISTVSLPDGPADIRGVLSLDNGKANAGKFGYLTSLAVPDSVISALKTELTTNKTIKVTYKIKDNATNKNGIRFYGETEGRYAVTPMIILNPNANDVGTLTGDGTLKVINNTNSFTNGSVEATVTPTGNNGDTAGITARVTGSNGYYASISKDGTTASITKLDGTNLKTVSGLKLSSNSYKMRLELVDEHLKLFVNDSATPIIDTYDSSYKTGSIGVKNSSGAATFADIMISAESYGLASDDAGAVTNDTNLLDIDHINVIGNIFLPSSGYNGSTITWSSNNTNVISNTGVVTRQAADTTVVLTATIKKGTQTATKNLDVLVRPAGSVAIHYNMDTFSNGVLTDSATNKDASLVGNGGQIVFDSQRGNVLQLDQSTYANLPAGFMQNYNEMTISSWFKVTSTDNWQRVFDFGSSQNNYIMFTVQSDTSHTSVLSFKNGNNTEQQIIGPAIQQNTWVHMAMTYVNGTATLYINGQEVVHRANIAFKPSDLGSTANNYIGKGQFNDPLFKGSIDDFRVYPTALSAASIAAVYAEKPVTAVAVQKSDVNLMIGQTYTNPVTLTPSDAAGKTIIWKSSNNAIATIGTDGKVNALSEGSSVITATCEGISATYTVTVQKAAVPTESISLDKPTISLLEGGTAKLTATISPDNATVKTVQWSSSDTNVVTVDEQGNIHAIAAGTANVTASIGNVKASCVVTVTKKEAQPSSSETNPTNSSTPSNQTNVTTPSDSTTSKTTIPDTGNTPPYSSLLLTLIALPVALLIKRKRDCKR